MHRFVLLIAIIVMSFGWVSVASAQILNTLGGFDDEAGWQGNLSLWVRASGGNTEVQDYFSGAKAQWQGGRQRARLMFSYGRSRSEGVDTAESGAIHLRHNLQWTQHLASLAFVQTQFNPFQSLQSRELFGAGLRFDIARSDLTRLSIGVAPMVEIEKVSGLAAEQNVRLSTFLDLDSTLREGVTVSATVFHQPSLQDFGDARTSASAELKVDLIGSLALSTALGLTRDSNPPKGVEKTDWSVRTGLSLDL